MNDVPRRSKQFPFGLLICPEYLSANYVCEFNRRQEQCLATDEAEGGREGKGFLSDERKFKFEFAIDPLISGPHVAGDDMSTNWEGTSHT